TRVVGLPGVFGERVTDVLGELLPGAVVFPGAGRSPAAAQAEETEVDAAAGVGVPGELVERVIENRVGLLGVEFGVEPVGGLCAERVEDAGAVGDLLAGGPPCVHGDFGALAGKQADGAQCASESVAAWC